MIAKRLKKYIDYKCISVYAFENAIGCSRGLIAKAIKDDKNIGSSIVENILRAYPDIDTNWLLTGQGNMLKTGHTQIGSDNRIDNSPINVNTDSTAEIARLKKEIEMLNSTIKDKDEIIKLLKQK